MNPILHSRREPGSWRRFSIRTALFAIAFAAAIFASYGVGVDDGRSLGPVVPINISATSIYSRDYEISDLVKSDDDAQLFITTIRNSVDVNNWDVAGGYAELHYDPGSQTIAVSHVWPGHVELVRFLETVREFAAYGGGLEDTLQNAATNF